MFGSSFGKATDGCYGDITLNPEEQVTFDALTTDNGETHSWEILRKTVTFELGLPPFHVKACNPHFFFFFSSSLCCNLILLYFHYCIEEATKPKTLESMRMKRVASTLKDPRLGARFSVFL